jgi:hypothetical protein
VTRARAAAAAALAALAALASACVVDLPPPEPLPEGDVTEFARTVQPVLDLRCADPSCHARADRPLALYSKGRHRRDPARTFLDEPLDAEELAANARAVAAFALEIAPEDGPDGCLVLRKPLALAAGGCGHAGGEIFSSRDDREYRAVRAWLAALAFPDRLGAPP